MIMCGGRQRSLAQPAQPVPSGSRSHRRCAAADQHHRMPFRRRGVQSGYQGVAHPKAHVMCLVDARQLCAGRFADFPI